MKSILLNKLSTLDAKYKRNQEKKHLRVFYGWSRVNKIRKKEAISVIFENDRGRDERTMKFINKMMNVVYVREQTDGEKIGVESAIRMFTEYSVFIDDKKFKGSLQMALLFNSEADKNNVPEAERVEIATKLRQSYLETHPGYREPIIQYTLEYDDRIKT